MKTFPKSLSILTFLVIIFGGMLAEPVQAGASSPNRAGSNLGMVLQSARIVDLKSSSTTPPPTPITPSGFITVTKPKYTWTKVAGATDYIFQIWKGTTLIGAVPSSASVCGATTCSNTPNIVLIYAAYSWRVAAKVGGFWTDMSAYKSFEVVNPALPPTPITPSGTITVTKPKYTWTKVAGATNYQFKIRKGLTIIYTSPVLSASVCGATNCSNTPNKVLTYAAHSWMVGAKVGGKWNWSAYKDFSVEKPVITPTPITPSGTITVTKPKYTWTKVAGATNYQFEIRKGLTTIYTSPVLSTSVCGASNCSNTPNKVLTFADHSWRVGAKVGGEWNWSAYKNFTVLQSAGFDSQFGSNAVGWSPLNGAWTVKDGYYQTLGVPYKWASSSHSNIYNILTYQVRLRRSGDCKDCNFGIYFNGTPLPLSGNLNWKMGYAFYINNTNKFAIYDMTEELGNGTYTPSSTGWNILKVTYNSSTKFAQFFINGARVAYGTYSRFTSGQVGVGLFGHGEDNLSVDWATLITSAPAISSSSGDGIMISDD